MIFVTEVEQSTQDVVVRIGNLLSRALRCAPGQLGASGDVETLKNLICLLLQCEYMKVKSDYHNPFKDISDGCSVYY